MNANDEQTTRDHGAGATGLLHGLGRRARALRTARGLTIIEMAAQAGLSARFLMDVESGRGNISVRRLADLAEALDTTPADLLSSHDVPPARAASRTPATTPARPIALLGLRGAGKTTIGKQLARRLKLPFVELDRVIEERAGLALGEIFSLHGEQYYRELERDALADLLRDAAPMVIAVGGGLVASPEAFAHLQRAAITVWLRAEADDYWNRVIHQGDRRPMQQHPQAREALRDLVTQRHPLYAQAHLTVTTSGLQVDQAVASVKRALAPRGAAGSSRRSTTRRSPARNTTRP